ncbi:MAG: OmpA family protein [Bacteroidota bacterium]
MRSKILIIIFCLFSISVFSQKTDTEKIEIQNLGTQINSLYSDYGPVITSDGSTLVFTSRRPIGDKETKKDKQYKEEVYISKYDFKTKTWSDATLLDATINVLSRNNSATNLSNDGQRMLLYRDDNNGNGDIYESKLTGTEWSEPEKLPEPINSAYHESSASISPDGKTIYFVSKRPSKNSLKKGDKNIWYCTQDENGNLGNAVDMGAPINSMEDEEMPFIHPDGKTLFFSSKGHSSVGGYDIFMSVYDEKTATWTEPESLGPPINTAGDDVGFVMQANGKTGFYSSQNNDAMGEKDVYKIIFHKDIMKKHLTLVKGRVLNEKGIAVSSKIVVKDKATHTIIGTFSSNSSTGEYSISLPEGKNYELSISASDFFTYKDSLNVPHSKGFNEVNKDITLKSKSAFISGRVLDENGNPLHVQIEIELIDSLTHQSFGKFKTDSKGEFSIKVPPGKNYNVVMNKGGYFFQSMKVKIPNTPGYVAKLEGITMKKVDIGKKMVLDNIFFDAGKAILRPESVSELDRALKLMNDMKSLQIEVSGHTDSEGNSANNKTLSETRAKAVVDHLISKGIDESRLIFVGYGSQLPVASNDTEEGKQLNRRTEFKVLKLDMAVEQGAELQRIKDAFMAGVKREASASKNKKSSDKVLPEDFKQYDTDENGAISPAEIFALIDSYFEGDKNVKFQNIADLIDHYLDE